MEVRLKIALGRIRNKRNKRNKRNRIRNNKRNKIHISHYIFNLIIKKIFTRSIKTKKKIFYLINKKKHKFIKSIRMTSKFMSIQLICSLIRKRYKFIKSIRMTLKFMYLTIIAKPRLLFMNIQSIQKKSKLIFNLLIMDRIKTFS